MAHPQTQQYIDAVTWAGWGLEVFPLKGKAPLTRHGHKDATTDQAQIESWWMRWPDANIGARPNPGTIVLDIDPRNGGGATWRELNKGKSLPSTFVTRTGSGGLHVWFSLPRNLPTRGSAGAGIDIKKHNGYLVMPGSIHPATGLPYRLESFHPLDSLPPLPQHLCKHVYRPAAPTRTPMPYTFRDNSGSRLIQQMAEAPAGQRNETLNRTAFIAAKENIDIFEELACVARCTGLADSEIRATINSAIRAAKTAGTGQVAA